MANNRMYLCHRPSGLAVYLGKRMGWGWYNVQDKLPEHLKALFAAVENEHSQDDFCVVMENASDTELAQEQHETEPFLLITDGDGNVRAEYREQRDA
jgi:hypothetical protein